MRIKRTGKPLPKRHTELKTFSPRKRKSRPKPTGIKRAQRKKKVTPLAKKVSSQKTKPNREVTALKRKVGRLQKENMHLAEQIGKCLEETTNIRIKADVMLGQILKALYIMGIGPDEILAKCQQMFMKKVVAE